MGMVLTVHQFLSLYSVPHPESQPFQMANLTALTSKLPNVLMAGPKTFRIHHVLQQKDSWPCNIYKSMQLVPLRNRDSSRVASGKSTLPSCPANTPSLASHPILYLTGVVDLQTHSPPSLFSIISRRRLASIYAAQEIWTTDHQGHHQNQCRHNEQDHN